MANKQLTLGSCFDGIGGWILAAQHAGIEPIWSSEIDRFPSAVTAKHFPNVKQLGDIKKLNGAKIEPVDVLTMGSPCQGLSSAGRRKGLNDERSGLFINAVELIRQMRAATNGLYPRFVVWENVPGALTSNNGLDFRAVLEYITESEIPIPRDGRWTNAGLVQRRACDVAWRILDAQYWGVPQRRKRIFLVADFGATGRCADKILFEPQIVPIDSKKSAKEEERTSLGAAKSARVSSPMGFNPDAGVIDSMPVLCDKVPTMKAVTRLAICAYSFDALESNSMKSKNPHSGCRIVDIARTLDTSTPDPAKNQGGIAVIERKLCGYVRRLTPLECERLQGLPDNWTLIDNKSCSDTARYRAIGNGMAQPCADYVLQRIVDVFNGEK